jgi:integrase
LDSLSLCSINTEIIQDLTSTALKHGYSIQTATHIRNVIRSLLSHAIRTGYYSGANPAILVTLPAMARKEAYSLDLSQIQYLMQEMRYPEKHLAILVMLTGLSVAEICGLQWRHLNLSSVNRQLDNGVIPPRALAVWSQWSRGEFSAVPPRRRRFVRITDLLASLAHDLKSRGQFTAPQDYVLVSRNGTPIHPENVAARRLKPIGESIEMPWLAWHVFRRTHVRLKSEFGRNLHEELKALPAFANIAAPRPDSA